MMGDSVEDFLNSVDGAMAACCLVLKKYDKKKERLQVHAHREALMEELNVTQNVLYMSGRHVTTVLAFLQQQLEPDTMSTLSRYHGM